MKSLRSFDIEACPKLENFPEVAGSMNRLESLWIFGTAIRDVPLSAGFLPAFLQVLSLYDCQSLRSLPESISCLSNLRQLFLDNCGSLRSLPELPSSTFRVTLNDCFSLETLSGAFKVSAVECINCFELLDGYSSMFSMLKNYLKGPKEECFRMVAPGDEIPEWVKHQGEGSSITMERPSVSDNNRLVGVVACCVFVVDENLNGRYYEIPHCSLSDFKTRTVFDSISDYNPISDHFFLRFYDADELYGMSWDGEGVEVSWTSDPRVEMKKCGVHPIYEQDLNDFNATTSNQCSSSLGDLNEYPEEYFIASVIL